MIHELIDPKKKKNKTSVTGNSKTIQNSKNFFEYSNFESSYYENKNTESSSATFIPPWLRNSLGLNQRNVLSHISASSDQKPSKIIQRNKETSQNEFDSLRQNTEHNCCREWKDQNDLVTKHCPQKTITANSADDVKSVTNNSERISAYGSLNKPSESESIEPKFLGKGDWIKVNSDVLTLDIGKLKDEDIRRVKLIRQKNKLRKRMSSDQKPSNLNKSDLDFLLQMKAREVVENLKKKDVHSICPEIRNFETKLLLLGGKSHDSNSYKIKQQDNRLLQEMRSQMAGVEDFERLIDHLKEMNLRDIVKSVEFPPEVTVERKHEEKEERKDKKISKEVPQKCEFDGRLNDDREFLLSTDDEDNIKSFSQFLSKNENLEEKKKCLEEIRNYFEKKRRLRLTKRRCLDEEKKVTNVKSDKKEENNKEKIMKAKEAFKGMKSKFGLCDEQMVEKAVEDTLQKFIDLYHISATPTVVETMKKSIFHCMSSNFPKNSRSPAPRKSNLDSPPSGGKESGNIEFPSFPEEAEALTKEAVPFKENKKRNFKTLIESSAEQNVSKERNAVEDETLKRLKKEFDNFLHSVQLHIDFTNLKLQSVILEKEEQATSSKNVQFVYNFTKKSLEQGKTGVSETKNYTDDGTQTAIEVAMSRRNVKVQALELKPTCEQSLQTEDVSVVAEATQTNDDQVKIREIKDLRSCDVNPGLYRMVKSREPGKFYLYPEHLKDRKPSSNFFFVKNKKLNRKKDLMSVMSKSSSKDRRIFLKERERAKLNKMKKLRRAFVRLESISSKQGKIGDSKGDSVNCLYFRNLDRSHSGLFTPKKETILTEENTTIRTDESEELALGDGTQMASRDHLGCFWFWNGEKISPGCDLKTHVENLLKEKLNEMITLENQNNALLFRAVALSKKHKKEARKISKKNAVLRFSNVVHNIEKRDSVLSEEESQNERKKTEEKKNESEETEEVLSPLFEEKSIRKVAVATQKSEQTCSSLKLPKLKVQPSKVGFPVKKKINRGNLILKQRRGKGVSVRKAENIAEAIEELKRIKLENKNSKNGGIRESDSFLSFSLSTKESKNEVNNPLPMVFRRQESLEAMDSNFKKKLKKLVSLVNCEIQRNDSVDVEDGNSIQNQQAEDQKHFELIETVLNRITHKERENLWNDVREFIKTRINRDINDDDDPEMCIEIEQDLHKNDRGKLCDILAKGHYRRNEGDIEVEIDLTLDDLERILRQRQRKIRRRNLYRSSGSNRFLSTSSIQSEFTRDDFRRYQKYLQSLTSGQGHVQEKEMKAFL